MRLRAGYRSGLLFMAVILSLSLIKLILATGHLISPTNAPQETFSIKEAVAGEKQQPAQPQAKPTSPSPAKKSSKEQELRVMLEGNQTKNSEPTTNPAPPPPPMPTQPLAETAHQRIETAAYLQKREGELIQKEQQLREQEERLNQMQQDVERKLQDLIGIQKEIQAYRNEKAEAKSASIRSLAQIYGSMKAKEAAKLLENMEDTLVVNIISTMKPNEAAEILSAMDSKRAAKISEALTRR